MRWFIEVGDCRAVMQAMQPATVDAIVTDPPYGLAFMGKEWDHGSPGIPFWLAALRVAKPGAHLVAFGGPRTFHRLTCALEDAGWEIRDCLCWLFGSGFPKSLDVSKAMDKAVGAEREVVGPATHIHSRGASTSFPKRPGERTVEESGRVAPQTVERAAITAPASDLAKQWAGWGTALKPSHEPVILAQKPYTPQQLLAILAPIVQGLIWSLWSVRSAVGGSGLSHPDSAAASGSAPGSANGSSGSFDPMATPAFGVLTAGGFWSIAPSLNVYLAALSEHANTFTTATASDLTTDLKILKSSLSSLMRGITTPAGNPTSGGESDAWLAVGISRSVLAKCERLSTTTAGETAFEWRADEGSALGGGDFAPAYEPIILARKPLQGTVAANIQQHSTGALNIDACRIATDWETDPTKRGWQGRKAPNHGMFVSGVSAALSQPNDNGRWPANVLLDEEAARQLDTQSGLQESGTAYEPVTGTDRPHTVYSDSQYRGRVIGYGDSGGASRFFYCAKASREEREAGLSGLPVKPLNWSSGEQSPGTFQSPQTERQVQNYHPTVKPLALMRWLCRLVTPPGGLILDPFMGSGSTGCAAVLEGFRFIGIEQDEEYAEIARRRIAHWEERHHPSLFGSPDTLGPRA